MSKCMCTHACHSVQCNTNVRPLSFMHIPLVVSYPLSCPTAPILGLYQNVMCLGITSLNPVAHAHLLRLVITKLSTKPRDLGAGVLTSLTGNLTSYFNVLFFSLKAYLTWQEATY